MKSKFKTWYHIYDLFDFGCYNGLEVGIVYLFDPTYIEFLINKHPTFNLINFKEITDLIWNIKIVSRFQKESSDKTPIELLQYLSYGLKFDELKYSGFIKHEFDENTSLKNYLKQPALKDYFLTDFDFEYNLYNIYEQTIFADIAGLEISLTSFEYLGIELNSKGEEYIKLSFDNTTKVCKTYSPYSNVIIALHWQANCFVDLPTKDLHFSEENILKYKKFSLSKDKYSILGKVVFQ